MRDSCLYTKINIFLGQQHLSKSF